MSHIPHPSAAMGNIAKSAIAEESTQQASNHSEAELGNELSLHLMLKVTMAAGRRCRSSIGRRIMSSEDELIDNILRILTYFTFEVENANFKVYNGSIEQHQTAKHRIQTVP